MELRELLELLYTARNRFATLQLAWRYTVHIDGMNDAFRRWASRQPPGTVAPLATASQGLGSGEWSLRWQIWWRKPDCWRDEQQTAGQGAMTRIICNGRFWSFNSNNRTLHTNVAAQAKLAHVQVQKETGHLHHHVHRITDVINDVPPLMDPSFLLASHDLTPVAETTQMGRKAVRVSAVCRPDKETVRDKFFWGAADEYELLVDKERGILLRYAAKVAGNAFAVAEVDRVVFDAQISDDVFFFTPPPQTTMQIVQ